MKIKALGKLAAKPRRAHQDDVGVDLACMFHHVMHIGEVTKVPLGVAMKPREGCAIRLSVRSSAAAQGILLLGGEIDPGYRGEVSALLVPLTKTLTYEAGDYIVQAIEYEARFEHELVDELDETARGDGGFGSTGLTGLARREAMQANPRALGPHPLDMGDRAVTHPDDAPPRRWR